MEVLLMVSTCGKGAVMWGQIQPETKKVVTGSY